MSAKLRPAFFLLLGLSAATLVNTVVAADPSAPPTPARVGAPQPPMPPAPKSPVESFRQLLAMKLAEREQALSNRPPEIRKRILEKVQHYLAMRADDRELSLRTTEVEWYFSNLRQLSAANRSAQLQSIPEADRQMVESRLAIWDKLSPEQQQDVLKYMPLLSPPPGVAPPSDDKAREINRRLDDWKKLSPDQRRDIYSRFQDFFKLTDEEREKTLHVLSEPERAQIEKALVTFDRMPPARRHSILVTLPRLEALSDQEREEFVRNADRWQAMTPAERQTLRILTTQLPPPVPMPPPFPPMPSKIPLPAARGSQVSLAATNSP